MTSYLRQAREYLTPVRQTTAFLSRGVLTPAEFVQAGDELVFKCPTWSWEKGDLLKARGHLPKEKQYLIIRNVPCPIRACTMENSILSETEVEMSSPNLNNDEDSGWLMSHIMNSIQQQQAEENDNNVEDDFDLVNSDGEIISKPSPPTPPPSVQVNENEENEYSNMEDYEDSNILMDDAYAQAIPGSGADSNILKVRTYDVSITYDKYYQTPRVWIFGYATDGVTPLTTEEMFQDVMSDYVRQTVTIETHPHILGPHLSIHPCQHAAVMKNIVQNMMSPSSDNAPNVEMYIFIFLKFVSSIIPTIQYDFTMDVDADVQKRKA